MRLSSFSAALLEKQSKYGYGGKNEDKLLPFTIVEVIKIKTVRLEMAGDVAYIKLNQFNLKTDEELENALTVAKAKKGRKVFCST